MRRSLVLVGLDRARRRPACRSGRADAYDVVAGQRCGIEVGTTAEPSYEPFTLAITRGPLEQC